MSSAAFLGTLAAAILVVYVAVRLARSYYRTRGARVVTCPDNHHKVEVKLDARRAVLGQSPRLSACTRWPEKQNCGQECLAEIAQAGESCLIRSILAKWYEGKNCAWCGTAFGHIDWATRKPGLVTPEGAGLDWSAVHADRIDEVLATHRPACFTCSVTNSFVRRHPDLVVDRSARPH